MTEATRTRPTTDGRQTGGELMSLSQLAASPTNGKRWPGLAPVADVTPRLTLALELFAGRWADRMERPSCDYCGGAMHVNRGMVAVKPDVYEQQIEACPKCNPDRPRGIPLTRLADTFEAFNLNLNPGMWPALARCKAVAKGEAPFALLGGEYGTGKTHLAIAALLAYGRGSFWKVPDLLRHIRRRAFDDNVGEDVALEPYRFGSGLLVLDDMGVQKDSEWAGQTLYAILDSRYELGLPTIITTNVMPSKMDGRIWDRFAASLVVCKGESVRQRAPR